MDYAVTFEMRAGDARRRFTIVIPAVDPVYAINGAHQIALAINEASGGLWKITGEYGAGEVHTAQEATR